MKKKILALLCVTAIAAAMITGCGANNTGNGASSDTKQETAEKKETAAPEEKVTPTFMYFVSGSDEHYDEEMSVFNELKAEYEGKVNFDLRNIDTDTEAAANFPVTGNTPMLIMLNTLNNISAMSPQTFDKETLTQKIEEAMEE